MQAQELAARNEVDVQGRVTVFAQAFRSLHFTVCMRTRRHLHLSCSGLALLKLRTLKKVTLLFLEPATRHAPLNHCAVCSALCTLQHPASDGGVEVATFYLASE
jgi:hypothetical protein